MNDYTQDVIDYYLEYMAELRVVANTYELDFYKLLDSII